MTEVESLSNYSAAAAYHPHYHADNPGRGYCSAVIGPTLEKFRKSFRSRPPD